MPESASASTAKRPINWGAYEHGRSSRHGSTGSLSVTSHVQFEPSSLRAPATDRLDAQRSHDDEREEDAANVLRRRRSSLSMRISSMTHLGGLNSIENFARSWSRAATFADIPPGQPSFIVGEEDEEGNVIETSRPYGEPISPAESRSLLRQQLQREGPSPEAILDDDIEPQHPDETSDSSHRQSRHETSGLNPHSSHDHSGYTSSHFSASPSGIYGSLSTRIHEPNARHSSGLRQMRRLSDAGLSKEQEPLLIKVIEQKDGVLVQYVVGQSTLPQTIFNSVNVLIGVGLLSLPLGIKQAGWLIGMLFLLWAAITTRYTAGLLAKCLNLDSSLVTFSDIAWKAFGRPTRVATGVLFSLELVAACVALVVLFADSLDALIPGLGVTAWKVICGIILYPLFFVPLHYLSISSVFGIFSCMGIVTLLVIDGLIKPHTPGSLREPATTSLLPERWSDLPLSFGLLMSPWGGHSVFGNIYRDMRHPQKYTRAINYTYVFTFGIDLAVAIPGYLMFGQKILDEVTSNIFLTDGYPHIISVCLVLFIAIIPITKTPLNARPIFVLLEDWAGLNTHTIPATGPLSTRSSLFTHSLRSLIRLGVLLTIVLLAILVPSFDTVMALLGSAMAFSICIILPVAFHLKLFYHEIGMWAKVGHWVLIAACTVMAIVGTVWVFLPLGVRHAMDGF